MIKTWITGRSRSYFTSSSLVKQVGTRNGTARHAAQMDNY